MIKIISAFLVFAVICITSAVADDQRISDTGFQLVNANVEGSYAEPRFTPIPDDAFEHLGPLISVPDSPVQVAACCKICRKGKACGNSCISRQYTCRQPPGCACDG